MPRCRQIIQIIFGIQQRSSRPATLTSAETVRPQEHFPQTSSRPRRSLISERTELYAAILTGLRSVETHGPRTGVMLTRLSVRTRDLRIRAVTTPFWAIPRGKAIRAVATMHLL